MTSPNKSPEQKAQELAEALVEFYVLSGLFNRRDKTEMVNAILAIFNLPSLIADRERLDWLEENGVLIGLSLETYHQIDCSRFAIDGVIKNEKGKE